MNRIAAFAPLLVLAVVVIASAVMLLRGGERENFAVGMVGRPVPALVMEPLGGGAPVSTEAMRGSPYLINVFASWCTPCRAEHAQLMTLRRSGVVIMGIAYKDAPEDTGAFLQELGNPYELVGMDPEGRAGLELGVTGAPETFVIGPDGEIRAAYRGAITPEIMRDVIAPALQD
jgi:cytochrome c biogenesis protein CcmG/thiol:disulfide interchange protein DsbE